jgi:predicted transcriptional regulator
VESNYKSWAGIGSDIEEFKKDIRQIGDDVGITERTAYGIVVDLEKAGYIKRTKVGTRNIYTINHNMPLVSRLSDAPVGDMLALFGWQKP